VLNLILLAQWATLVQRVSAGGRAVPRSRVREVESFLRCGILAWGCANACTAMRSAGTTWCVLVQGLASIALAHVAPQDAIENLRPVLVATATKATLANVGKTLLVLGDGTEVYRVSRMVRLIDVPPGIVFDVVVLKHAVATDVARGLELLDQGYRSGFTVSVRADGVPSVEATGAPGILEACDEMQAQGAQRGAKIWRRGMDRCSSARRRAG
jgi:hypothetical protein